MFHVADAKDLDKYNSWNFTRQSHWFDFYTSPSTTLLFETMGYRIGEFQPKFVSIPIMSEKVIHKEQKSSVNVLGVQIGSEDEYTNTVIWEPATNVDENRKITMRDTYMSSTILVKTNFDFTQRIYEINYIDSFDVVASLGGFRAAVTTLFGFCTPFVILFPPRALLGHKIQP